jgi:uncharacterized UPF0160 family protein
VDSKNLGVSRMAKITISRIFEISKLLATETGQELQSFFEYFSQVNELVLRVLRKGLTFEDNMQSIVREYEVTSDIEQAINVDKKTPSGIIITKVVSESVSVTNFVWYNTNTETKAKFTFSTPGKYKVKLIVLY